LWSLGGSWEISRENFYSKNSAFPYLRIKATYGSSGNVNTSVSHFPTARYYVDNSTDMLIAQIKSVGNPSLRWEQVYTFNTGVDFASRNQRLQGSVDYYVKNASDLVGNN